MGYIVSALPDYTEQPEKIIYDKLFTGSPILDLVKGNGNLMTGVKSAETINIINTEFVWQAQGCSFNASGGSTFSQRTVTPGKIKIDGEFCERDLEPKFTQKSLIEGSNYDSLTYNTEIVDDSLQKVSKRMAVAVWKGDTGSSDQYLKHFNGLVKTLNADIPAGNKYTGTTWSEANSRTALKGIANLIIANNDVYKDGISTIKVYCSPANRTKYAWKLITDNAYHIDPKDGTAKLYIEGTTIEVVGDIGLAGTDYFYAIEDENLVGATDMKNEEEKVDVWYSKDDRKIKLNAEWKFGINVAFETRVFSYLGV